MSLFLVRYGELGLKSPKVKRRFQKMLLKNIEDAFLKKRNRLYLDRLKEFGNSVGLTLISQIYRGPRHHYEWKCKNGHLIKRTKQSITKSVRRGKNTCTICAGTSKKI